MAQTWTTGGDVTCPSSAPGPALRWLVPAGRGRRRDRRRRRRSARSPPAAEPALPPRSAAQLLVDLQTARLDGLSGTVVQRADLGLPALPGWPAGRRRRPDVAGLRHATRCGSGTPARTRRGWRCSSTLGETDVIRNGRDVWIWTAASNKATHRTLAGRRRPAGRRSRCPAACLPATPQEAADLALAAIDPTTEVTTDRHRPQVAGRDAYELVLAPRDTASLVGQVAARHRRRPSTCRCASRCSPKGANDAGVRGGVHPGQLRPPGRRAVHVQPAAGHEGDRGPGRSRRRPADKATPSRQGDPDQATPDAKPAERQAGRGEPTRRRQGLDRRCWWPSCRPARRRPAARRGRPGDRRDRSSSCRKVSGAWGSGRLLTGTLFSALLTDDGRVLGRRGHPGAAVRGRGTTK